jgi:uncharacterized protein (TIGR02145 family)
MTAQKGVIYYKLDPQFHYENDVTLNCGLTGGDIDGNFNFLRGYDIKTFEVSEDKRELTVVRHNGEKLAVNIYDPQFYHFDYDSVNGILTVTMTKDEEDIPVVVDELTGFLSERNFHVYTDATIEGDGTKYKPLSLSTIARTGTYQPALDLIDVTAGEEMPEKGTTKGERHITKENVSPFGLLYPMGGMLEMQKRLEEIGSEWRVPTKEDWDQLLNMSEACFPDKNHDNPENPVDEYLGKDAGAHLKSQKLWDKIEDTEELIDGDRFILDGNGEFILNDNGNYVLCSDDIFDFSIYPLNKMGKEMSYWVNTSYPEMGEMFVKTFTNESRAVKQNISKFGDYLGIRLVKDFDGTNSYDIEEIDGQTVSTILLEMSEVDRGIYDKNLVWTKENVGFGNAEYSGVTSGEWLEYANEYISTRYYINDWDGKKWVKHEIHEGESIVIANYREYRMHEWRLIDGEFFDTADLLKEQFQKILDTMTERIKYLEGEEYKRELYNEFSDKIFKHISGTTNEIKVVNVINTTDRVIGGIKIGFADDTLFK